MRTTFVLDDALFRAAKKASAERGVTLSELMNDALRLMLRSPQTSRRPTRLPTRGERRLARHVSTDEIARALYSEH